MVEDNDQEVKAAISELEKRISDIPKNELYENNLFYRFLKARDFNIDNAEKMLREHLAWRKKYDVENISKCKLPEVLEKYIPFNVIGHDKEGNVVRYIPAGNIDWIGINASCKLEDFEKRIIQYYEEDMKALESNRERDDKSVAFGRKFVFIYNMENFSFSVATDKKMISTFIVLINLFLNNYPETLKCCIVINASTYFYILYALLQKFLPSSIQNKIKFYADDSWKKDFPNMIDPKILPGFLGGDRKDPDGNPLCNTFINHGGPVPEKYYIHRSKRPLSSLPDIQQLTLPRANFHEVFVEVKEPDSYLEWEFETESRDIGFGLFHEDEKGNKTEIVPIIRIETSEYAETGIYRCKNKGKYIVVFDNTYSILRKKDIYYRIKVRKEQEEEFEDANSI